MVQSTELAPPLDELWSHVMNPVRQFGERVAHFFSPSAEAAATTESYEIALELPGIAEDEIHLEVHGNRLVVTGEKRVQRQESGRHYYVSERMFGQFRRAFHVPEDGDVERVRSVHRDGILTITIPKVVPQRSESRKIPISRSGVGQRDRNSPHRHRVPQDCAFPHGIRSRPAGRPAYPARRLAAAREISGFTPSSSR